jgi:amino acid adenylation domain-containing protein
MRSEETTAQFNGSEIAVIGMAGRFPGANDLKAFWQNLRDGVESITFFTDEELLAAGVDPATLSQPNYVKAASNVDDVDLFDASFFGYNHREAEITHPQHRVFLECAWEALENAGYDTERYDGLIGAFAGTGTNHYWLFALYTNPQLTQAAGDIQTMVGSDLDYLTTRVSYKLNLKGPSYTVFTACSTSLVATHLACQSLLNGECDMALAGGISLKLPGQSGYLYNEGDILSPDGHCRSFDEKGQGTIFGSGAGVVVLKRLSEAMADGDTIHAIIRGSAINNDGSSKIGYTAPSVTGQAQVIGEALAASQIDPETVGYVETHGTATPLGDPIEMAALTQAYRQYTDKKDYCGIGSVKSNVGHLGTAAGITSLIKTILALENKMLPPSLYCDTPNTKIDFANSPFYVNTALKDWPESDEPRRAGVSSFGIGGTNVHAVLEEAPPVEPTQSHRSAQVLTLSARSEAALDVMTGNLLKHLEASPDLNLADVAYTLQLGRRAFNYRRTLAASSITDAIEKLRAADPQHIFTQYAEPGNRPVAFMFPGAGAQHVNMGRELYDGEPVFKHWLDHCAAFLKPHIGQDLRTVLYPASDHLEAASAQLRHTHLALPALFAVEYALAQTWMSFGIKPQAMLGHSMGEYVAACLAGVFSVEDGLLLVMTRGRLMETLAPGRMLSVPLSADDLAPMLGGNIWLAAVNGPRLCTLAGTLEAIDVVEAQLRQQGHDVRAIPVDVAAHSGLIEPILEDFAKVVNSLKFSAPKLPYLSNITGTWITAAEATDPAYWVRHLRHTVLFASAAEHLLKDPDIALLEVGPGHALGSFARMQPSYNRERMVLASLRHAQDAGSDQESVATALGRLWLAGVAVDWKAVHASEQLHRIPLPTYPFERQRYWININLAGLQALSASDASLGGSVRAEALPEPETVYYPRTHMSSAYLAPRDALEEQIATIWRDLLGLEQVGINDNFFELGGHSVLATQLIARVRTATHTAVSLQNLFSNPSVAGLAKAVVENRNTQGVSETDDAATALPVIVPQPDERHLPFPLTDLQQAYWIGRSGALELGNVATHGYLEVESEGLDLGRFNVAVQRVIDRHEMLRAIVLPDGTQQILQDLPPYIVECTDLRALSPEEQAKQLDVTYAELSHQMLPSDRWPLFDLRATQLTDTKLRLHISYDFLITDALSLMIMRRELAYFYLYPDKPLPPITLSFRDYVLAEAAFQKSAEFHRSLAYWRTRLADLPPAPELPLAQNPATLDDPKFVRRQMTLDKEKWSQLKRRAAQADMTGSAVLLAAFAEVLAVWSKSPRFTINLTLFNRLPVHPQVNDIVGDFTSLTLVGIDYTAPDSFETRARAVQTQLWANLDNRYVSGVQVLRELAHIQKSARAAIMPVVFTSAISLASASNPEDEVEAPPEMGRIVRSISQTPQVWLDHQVFESDGALLLNWDAVEALFPPNLLNEMFATYGQLLKRLATDETGWQATQAQHQLTPATHLAQRAEVNATEAPIPGGLLHTGFLQQAAHRPTQTAIITPGTSITYAELYRLTNRIGRWLQEHGAQPNKLVAVVMEKGWEQVAAVLGILQAGAAYLPIDPALPSERLQYLLQNGEADLVLTQSRLDQSLTWPESVQRLAVDGDDVQTISDEPLPTRQQPGDLAYVIFTSGSTGQPKGVMIDHRAALNTIVDMNSRFKVGPNDRVFALSALNFDLSVYDIFGLLAAGGTILMPDEKTKHDPAHWAAWLGEAGITIWDSVPALMELFVQYLDDHAMHLPPSLRLVMMSGDWIPTTLPDRIRAHTQQIEIFSLGGATEAAIWSILNPINEVHANWKSIPYGKPMVNQSFQVLDDWLQPRPLWVPGQLYIGGIGLAQGYWRDPQKSSDKFFIHPRTGQRLYRTGDLGRYLPDGNIEFLGREDFQVKIQGYRIELGEIEAALLQHPNVRATAVIATGTTNARRLVGFVVPNGEPAPTSDELRLFLRTKLPEYMIPVNLITLESLPLSSNGKVDRQALTSFEQLAGPLPNTFVAPRNAIEEVLVNLWAELLEVTPVSVHDSFFHLGGHSVLAIRVTTWIRDTFRMEVPIRRLFEAPTIAELAQTIEAGEAKPGQAVRIARTVLKLQSLTPEERQKLLNAKQTNTQSS